MKTVVRMPGPSSVEHRCMFVTNPVFAIRACAPLVYSVLLVFLSQLCFRQYKRIEYGPMPQAYEIETGASFKNGLNPVGPA
jgi:hypothetical protein